VDAVVSGVGTGGTLVGLAQGFRDAGCQITPFAARPTVGTSVTEVECSSFSSRIPGVVEGISQIYSREHLPGVCELDVNDEEAINVTRMLIRRGFPVGPSSGLNYQAAIHAAAKLQPDARIVTVFPDRMERYFSTELFRGWKETLG
jgi:cysteine synthase A